MRRESPARMADYMCPATCPEVDAAFGETETSLRFIVAECNHDELTRGLESLCDKVKECGTEKLRAALIEACEMLREVESERDDLKDEVARLERKSENLSDEVKELSRELDALSQ